MAGECLTLKHIYSFFIEDRGWRGEGGGGLREWTSALSRWCRNIVFDNDHDSEDDSSTFM